MSRPGGGENANGQILLALLYAPEDYSVGRITQVTDGVTFGVEEDNSLRVVREVLEAEGWGVTNNKKQKKFKFQLFREKSAHATPIFFTNF